MTSGEDRRKKKANNKTKVEKRQRDPRATRETILKAAEKLFISKGFDGTTMSEVARLGDVNQSLIHYYFGTKKGLLLEVMRRHLVFYGAKMRERMSGLDESDEFLKDSVEAYFRFLNDFPDFVRMGSWFNLFFQKNPLTMRDQSVGVPEEDEAQRYIYELVDNIDLKVEEMQERGEVRSDLNPAVFQVLVYCIVEHWYEAKNRLLRRLRPEERSAVTDETYLDAAVKVLLEGVLSR